MSTFKPMLACSTIPSVALLDYPVMASPKLDGIRCLIVDGKPVSRTLKPIPNKHVQKVLSALNLPSLDGELMLKSGDFNNVQSAIMCEEGKPDFQYVVFDNFANKLKPYSSRFITTQLNSDYPDIIQFIPNIIVNNAKHMQELLSSWLAEGYEGAIVRDPTSPYKYGRSTLKQGWMLKLKVFNDAEATIIGYKELMHNDNEATEDNLGQTVRSSHQANQYGGDTLGSLICEFNGEQFSIGTGFDAAERSRLWTIRDKLLGQLVTFKYQELTKYGVPRFPSYKGLRHKEDLS